MRKTSCSRQFACNCTSMQSFENRFSFVGNKGTPSVAQISSHKAGWALPLKTAIGLTRLSPPRMEKLWRAAHGRPDIVDQLHSHSIARKQDHEDPAISCRP